MTQINPESDDVDHFVAQRRRESPDIDAEPMLIFGRINRIAARMAPHMEELFAGHGLERGEFDVLATLQRSGPPYTLSPTELYTSLMISSGGLTHRLKQLEKAGLIRRMPSPADGRSMLVQMTEQGYARTRQAFAEDMRLEMKWLQALQPDERKTLAALLRRLYAAMPVHSGDAPPG